MNLVAVVLSGAPSQRPQDRGNSLGTHAGIPENLGPWGTAFLAAAQTGSSRETGEQAKQLCLQPGGGRELWKDDQRAVTPSEVHFREITLASEGRKTPVGSPHYIGNPKQLPVSFPMLAH